MKRAYASVVVIYLLLTALSLSITLGTIYLAALIVKSVFFG